MAEIGYWALVLSLAGSLYAALAAVLGARRRYAELVISARNAILAVAVLVTLAAVALFYLLLSRDFSIKYVFEHVTSYQPTIYNISAFWGGLEGSQLLWLWLLAAVAVFVALRRRDWDSPLRPYALAVIAAAQALFAALLIFVTNPFEPMAVVQSEGFGLNPLLQNPFMVIHPPIVFLGYAASTVPFAYAVAALITGRLDRAWVRGVRRWNLITWLFLGGGIMLGGWWAYLELGWGGYWGWDPVENAVAIPWLVATAGLHSAIVQERRGMFKTWTIVLLTLTFELCLLATFITRSGVIQSVHAFGTSSLGYYYLGFIVASLALTLGLMAWRRSQLQSEHEIDSTFARETGFFVTNLLFVGAALAVLLGTFYPAITELTSGVSVALGTDFFNRVFGPIALGILLVMGFCTAMGWRLGNVDALWRAARVPAAISVVVTVALVVLGIREPIVLVALLLTAFAAATTLAEFYRGLAARRQLAGESLLRALHGLITTSRRRYGGYVVHLSVVLIAVGIVGSSFYQVEQQVVLEQGEAVTVKGYRLVYEGADFQVTQEKQRNAAIVAVYRNDRLLDRLTPESNFHWNIQQRVSEVDIRYSLTEDLYLVLAGLEDDGQLGIFQVFINPLVNWIWIGGVLMILGTLVAAWPSAAEQRAAEARARALQKLQGEVQA
ncbi:MAG: heme lyase CcmF/NrfE family subunit [Chloroflexota bacterium]